MDLPVYLRVLWRFRVIVALGLIAAFSLSFLSLVRVNVGGSPMLKYRKPNVYVSYSTLFVTQPGFPWGNVSPPPSANAQYFTILAQLFTQFATSDQVHRLMLRGGPVLGKISAVTVTDPSNRQPLPLVQIGAVANSPHAAISLDRRATSALLSYIQQQQSANAIPDARRVVVQPISLPQTASVFHGRKLTIGIAVFIAVLLATCGLAFLLENLRPQLRSETTSSLRTVESDAA